MLTDTRIRNAKAKDSAYKLADTKGLYIEVRPTGAKIWRYRYRVEGKENVYTIGEYNPAQPDHVSLDDARARRIEARALVKAGQHPKAHRDAQDAVKRAEGANTFESIAREWIERCSKGTGRKRAWSAGHADGVQKTIERYVFPKIGALPIRSVGAPHIRVIMDAVTDAGFAVTAINIRQWCGAIFAHAARTERVDGDPTIALREYIERPDVQHKTPLTKAGIKTMSEKIETTGFPQTKIEAYEIGSKAATRRAHRRSRS